MSKQKTVIKKWDEKTFSLAETEWQKLLGKSGADPIFLSWYWLRSWWCSMSIPSLDQLCIYAIYSGSNLVGLAPFYITKTSYIKGIVRFKRMQFIGKRYHGDSGLRSEYMDVIIKSGFEDIVALCLTEKILESANWDEIVLSDIVNTSVFYKYIKNEIKGKSLGSRILGQDNCYSVSTIESFEDYLLLLGKNTRLKLYNRRKKLSEYGEITLNYLDLNEDTEIYEQIGKFHVARYGAPVFNEINREIISKMNNVAITLNDRNYSSILSVGGKPLSVMVNLFFGDRIYNFQLGYLEDFDKKISLGTLHLGYTIEMAFNDKSVKSFDLMAGGGKNSDYKSRLANVHTTLESFQVLRKPILRFLYFINDHIVAPTKVTWSN